MVENFSGGKYRQIGGVLIALLGAVLFSTKAVFVKLAYQYEVDPVMELTNEIVKEVVQAFVIS